MTIAAVWACCAGMDIASETSQCGAAAVFLSCRRRVHVVPRFIFCTPADALLPSCVGVTMHRKLQELLVTVFIRLSRGSQSSFKFPAPDFGILKVPHLPHIKHLTPKIVSRWATLSAEGKSDGVASGTALLCHAWILDTQTMTMRMLPNKGT